MSNSDKLLDQDPYLRLGYGLNAYFDIIVELMVLMLLCMLVTTPLMIKYGSFDSLQGQIGYQINRFSLGNLGGSMTHCSQFYYTEPDSTINL